MPFSYYYCTVLRGGILGNLAFGTRARERILRAQNASDPRLAYGTEILHPVAAPTDSLCAELHSRSTPNGLMTTTCYFMC